MKVKSVPSSWIQAAGRRLDVGPYLFGAVEARERIRRLAAPKQALKDLTAGPGGGIFKGPMFSRVWVTDPAHGVPFIGSSSMLLADLSHLPLLSRKHAHSPRLRTMEVQPGMTLISRSGTIGRMVYARPDMAGMWTSEHIMKVCPDPALIPPGYLYAFLSSRFGVPMVVGGTYGAIIQHIEPEHIAGLPVPRFGGDLEQEIHQSIMNATKLRVDANSALHDAIDMTLLAWGVQDLDIDLLGNPDIQILDASKIRSCLRLDAFFYGGKAVASDKCISDVHRNIDTMTLGQVTREVFETPRFGRISVEDADFGVPFLSISDIVRLDPKPSSLLSKKQAIKLRALVNSGWLILPRVGQLQGVFGTACFIPQHLNDVAVSDNNIRIVPDESESGAYLWAALSTKICYVQIIRRACGTSIPYLDAERIRQIPIPWPSNSTRAAIADLVIGGMEKRSAAIEFETSAKGMVERALEGVTS